MSERPVPRSWIEEVRFRLASPPARRLRPQELRPASVLVSLYVEAGELWTMFVRRADHLAHHPSQIAFPGGAREVGEDAWQAALREAEEELGLDPRVVLPLGELDETETPSGFHVVPCVGGVPSPLALRPDGREVADLLRVPLRALADPRLVEERRIVFNGVPRALRVYHFGSHQVWGATARIVENLLARLGLVPDPEALPGDD